MFAGGIASTVGLGLGLLVSRAGHVRGAYLDTPVTSPKGPVVAAAGPVAEALPPVELVAPQAAAAAAPIDPGSTETPPEGRRISRPRTKPRAGAGGAANAAAASTPESREEVHSNSNTVGNEQTVRWIMEPVHDRK